MRFDCFFLNPGSNEKLQRHCSFSIGRFLFFTAWCTDGNRYYADRIDEGRSDCRMISPYVTIGYLPNDPDAILSDVFALLADGDAVLNFNDADGLPHQVLWRSSMLDYKWMQGYGVTLVDFSSELFGLSTLWLSSDFYGKHSTAPPSSSK